MSPSPCIDLDVTTAACVEWDADKTRHTLVHPDPQRDDITLQSRFASKTATASFQLHCPARVKGIEAQSHIVALIHAASIISFDFKECSDPPETVNKKLKCKTFRLRLQLNRPVVLVAATAATEPVQPRKRVSGQVLDALRSLATVTTLDIYVPERDFPHIKLAAVAHAVSHGRLQPLDDVPKTLASLYNGSGGRLINWPVALDAPPSYPDLEPPPPLDLKPTPVDKTKPIDALTGNNDRKRRRIDGPNSPEGDPRSELWTAVVEMRNEMRTLVKRVEHLETENAEKGASIRGLEARVQDFETGNAEKSTVIQSLEARVQELEKQNREQRDEIDDLHASCEKAAEDVEADRTDLLEVHEELDDLNDRVEAFTQGELDVDIRDAIVENVTDCVLEHMLDKDYNAKICISKS